MRLCLALLAGLASQAFGGSLAGPVPGFILDTRSASIRPVLGIPGAMQLGTAVDLPFGVSSADFAPDGTFAVAVSNEDEAHLYVVSGLSADVKAWTDLGAVPAGSAVSGVNASGTGALLSSPGQIQFVSGLPNAPALSDAVATEPVSAAILDSAAQCALVATAGALNKLCRDRSSERVLTREGMSVSALALLNDQDVLLADKAAQQVLRLSNGSVSTLATADDGVAAPVGLQATGNQVLVSDAGASAVFVLDLSGQKAIQTISLDFAPSRLQFLADRSILLLNDPTAIPFLVLSLPAMQSFFIPTN